MKENHFEKENNFKKTPDNLPPRKSTLLGW